MVAQEIKITKSSTICELGKQQLMFTKTFNILPEIIIEYQI